jgi:hypothetical protein
MSCTLIYDNSLSPFSFFFFTLCFSRGKKKVERGRGIKLCFPLQTVTGKYHYQEEILITGPKGD